MSASATPMLTSSITLHRASTRYILLRISSGRFLDFDLVLPAMKDSFRVGTCSIYRIYNSILLQIHCKRKSFRNFYIIFQQKQKPRRSGGKQKWRMALFIKAFPQGERLKIYSFGSRCAFSSAGRRAMYRMTAQTVESSELTSVTPLVILVTTETNSAGWPKMYRLRK